MLLLYMMAILAASTTAAFHSVCGRRGPGDALWNQPGAPVRYGAVEPEGVWLERDQGVFRAPNDGTYMATVTVVVKGKRLRRPRKHGYWVGLVSRRQPYKDLKIGTEPGLSSLTQQLRLSKGDGLYLIQDKGAMAASKAVLCLALLTASQQQDDGLAETLNRKVVEVKDEAKAESDRLKEKMAAMETKAEAESARLRQRVVGVETLMSENFRQKDAQVEEEMEKMLNNKVEEVETEMSNLRRKITHQNNDIKKLLTEVELMKEQTATGQIPRGRPIPVTGTDWSTFNGPFNTRERGRRTNFADYDGGFGKHRRRSSSHGGTYSTFDGGFSR